MVSRSSATNLAPYSIRVNTYFAILFGKRRDPFWRITETHAYQAKPSQYRHFRTQISPDRCRTAGRKPVHRRADLPRLSLFRLHALPVQAPSYNERTGPPASVTDARWRDGRPRPQ